MENIILQPEADGLNEPLIIALALARARGVPTYQIAAQIGVHPSYLSRWATGERHPNREQAERLADALDVDVSELFPSTSEAALPGGSATRRTVRDDAAAV